jgi:hypothetical protein
LIKSEKAPDLPVIKVSDLPVIKVSDLPVMKQKIIVKISPSKTSIGPMQKEICEKVKPPLTTNFQSVDSKKINLMKFDQSRYKPDQLIQLQKIANEFYLMKRGKAHVWFLYIYFFIY